MARSTLWGSVAALASDSRPFALLYRPRVHRRHIDVVRGTATTVDRVIDLPVAPGGEILALLPYRQLRERGFDCHDDGTPLMAMVITQHHRVPLGTALSELPDDTLRLMRGRFEPDDDRYARLVSEVVTQEIGRGQGSNFVIRRTFIAELTDYSLRHALAIYRRLLLLERGAHWTFLVHCGDRTLVGATPERHISLAGGVAQMSPISGTYRYPPDGVSLRGLSGFLSDEKETDELSMVLDEELKTMARICRDGGRVQGPYLRQMGHLAHTEYAIRGDTDLDVREVLRESMFAPPVVGSPLQNACRIIRRYEDSGRGYYSGVAALIGHDAAGSQTLDSAILIRTADIDTDGCIRIGVGATLVRHSQPVAEVAETAGKAAALLAALDDSVPELRPKVSAVLRRRVLAVHPRVRRLLRRRNARLSRFWLGAVAPTLELRGLRVAVVDAEDMFTAMLEHQLRSVGAWVRVYPYPEFAGAALDGCDVVVLGPGPGDPTDAADPKMSALRAVVQAVAARHMPLLGLCLGHQVLAAALDFRVAARAEPNQGVQREVDLFGIVRRVGFYNTFVACSETDVRDIPGWGPVRVAREPATGEVHALRGERVGGFQFHPESVLTEGGPHLLLAELVRLSAPALITRTAAT